MSLARSIVAVRIVSIGVLFLAYWFSEDIQPYFGMGKTVYWIWNGWGILFTVFLAFSFASNFLIPNELYPKYRDILGSAGMLLVGLNIILCGWISGLLSYPIALMISGLLTAMLNKT